MIQVSPTIQVVGDLSGKIILQALGEIRQLEDGGWEGSAQFKCLYAEAFKLMPVRRKTAHPEVAWLIADQIVLRRARGGLAEIEVSYNGLPPGKLSTEGDTQPTINFQSVQVDPLKLFRDESRTNNKLLYNVSSYSKSESASLASVVLNHKFAVREEPPLKGVLGADFVYTNRKGTQYKGIVVAYSAEALGGYYSVSRSVVLEGGAPLDNFRPEVRTYAGPNYSIPIDYAYDINQQGYVIKKTTFP